MSSQQPPQTQPQKMHFPVRTIMLVLAVILITVFAMKNGEMVKIWPIGNGSVFMVILISFVLGLLIGVLLHSMFTTKMRMAPDERIIERNDR